VRLLWGLPVSSFGSGDALPARSIDRTLERRGLLNHPRVGMVQYSAGEVRSAHSVVAAVEAAAVRDSDNEVRSGASFMPDLAFFPLPLLSPLCRCVRLA
jgi:hypothetical protein